MSLKEIFMQHGGINLLRQYIKSGVLFVAISEFILLGKSKAALEILRLSVQLKIKKNLERKYKEIIDKSNPIYNEKLSHTSSNKVWICWLQGMENAPEIVNKCYKSVIECLSDKEVILITSKNINDYVKFPDYITKKWKNGVITNTHFTDLLRLELLIKYGGMWLDATVYCSAKREEIPDFFFNSDLFFYQKLKPGNNGNSIYLSSWLISAKTNNKILITTKNLLYKYWEDNDDMYDYFLFHIFFSIALEYYPEEWRRVIPLDNSTPHILLLRLFDQYNENIWKAIKSQTPFHKLTYKFDREMIEIKETYYSHIIMGGGEIRNIYLSICIKLSFFLNGGIIL